MAVPIEGRRLRNWPRRESPARAASIATASLGAPTGSGLAPLGLTRLPHPAVPRSGKDPKRRSAHKDRAGRWVARPHLDRKAKKMREHRSGDYRGKSTNSERRRLSHLASKVSDRIDRRRPFPAGSGCHSDPGPHHPRLHHHFGAAGTTPRTPIRSQTPPTSPSITPPAPRSTTSRHRPR